MKTDQFFPDPRYQSVMAVNIVLFFFITLFWWSVPGLIILLNQEIGLAVAAVIAIAAHAALLLPALWLASVYVRRLRYELHADEVVIHAGIVTRSVRHVPLRAVTNLKVTRGPVERLFGLGTLHVETAGTSGQSSTAEGVLRGLAQVDAVYRLIADELLRYRSALAPTQAGADLPPEGNAAEILVALLDEVRAIRARLDASG